MRLIKEIYEKTEDQEFSFKLRKAVRVILQKEDTIALLHVKRDGYHKLPGGGIEHGEGRLKALSREVSEETGCSYKKLKPLGITIEYKYTKRIVQISYFYTAHLEKDTLSLEFTAEECRKGFYLIWVKPTYALQLLSADTPSDYDGTFIIQRDYAAIKEAVKHFHAA